MNKNEEENQRDEAVSASEASLDEELAGEATKTTDDTEGTEGKADNPLAETERSADQADNFSTAQEDDDTDDIAESETDWLIDSGLAAAINPQSDVPEEASEDRESDNTDQEGAESDLYDDDDEGESCEEDEPQDDDYDGDLAKSDDEDDFGQDEQASLTDSDLENPAPPTRAVWPIVFGGIALVLIGFGGWDLFQERVTLQARITELEQALARARESAALDARTVPELEVENAALKLQLNTLYQDYDAAMAELRNASITGEATGESDDVAASVPTTALAAQDDEPGRNESSEATPSGTSGWFINIGAYASSQSANTWALRLQNSGYDVSVTEIQTSGGMTLNRVRLTGFDSKVAAKDFAQELETDYGTGPLWVGELPSGN